MENSASEILAALPESIRNTHLHFVLQGWPAAVAVVAVCAAGAYMYSLRLDNAPAIK